MQILGKIFHSDHSQATRFSLTSLDHLPIQNQSPPHSPRRPVPAGLTALRLPFGQPPAVCVSFGDLPHGALRPAALRLTSFGSVYSVCSVVNPFRSRAKRDNRSEVEIDEVKRHREPEWGAKRINLCGFPISLRGCAAAV